MSELHAIGNFRTMVEAEIAAGLLREADIPYLIQSAEGVGVVPMPGGATILVRPNDFPVAVRVLGYPRLV
ncbi:MAG: hypothetical protein HY700_00740 [Gemmatimonadetes bacterium]|nr:hypothetical protein [Gemmatimonadota bacterium]